MCVSCQAIVVKKTLFFMLKSGEVSELLVTLQYSQDVLEKAYMQHLSNGMSKCHTPIHSGFPVFAMISAKQLETEKNQHLKSW